jgi:hypothetical protein
MDMVDIPHPIIQDILMVLIIHLQRIATTALDTDMVATTTVQAMAADMVMVMAVDTALVGMEANSDIIQHKTMVMAAMVDMVVVTEAGGKN